MGRNLCRHSIINIRCCGNIFPLIQLVLGREIQGLSFNVQCSVKIRELKVINLCFGDGVKIHVFSIGKVKTRLFKNDFLIQLKL